MATGTKIGTAYFEVGADTTKAQAAIKGLGSTLNSTAQGAASSVGKAAGAVDEFGNEIESTATATSGRLGKLGDSLKGVGAAAAIGLAGAGVAAVGAFAADSVRAFSELEQSVGGTEAVFGDAADAIDRIASTSASSMGLAKAEFRTATTSIGGQLKRMTGDVDLAAEQSVALTKVAADLAATYGGTTAEAVAALGSAFRGEADPAERFNLNLKIGAVNAKAVELGLAESTDAVDDNARAQATLALITEQSADAQGQFAREIDTVAGKSQVAAANIENMKARAGEALAPFKNLTSEVQLLGAQALGSVASSFQNLIGDITPAQDAINQFEILTGASADTLEALVTINQETGVSFADLAAEMALTAGETEPLTQSQKDFLTQIGFTQDEIIELDNILAGEHATTLAANAVAVGENRYDEMTTAVDTTTEAIDVNTAAIDENITILEEHQNKIRAQTDPLFALWEATRKQAEAQAAVNEATGTAVEGTPEYTDLLADLYLANQDLAFASQNARVQTDLTRQEFVDAGIAAGGDRVAVEKLADELYDLDAIKIDPKHITFVINQLRGSVDPSLRGGFQAQHGMAAFAGQMIEVGEVGRELFIPEVAGRIIPHTSTERIIDALQGGWTDGGGMYVGDINVTVQGNASPATAVMIGDEIENALRRVAAGRTVR